MNIKFWTDNLKERGHLGDQDKERGEF